MKTVKRSERGWFPFKHPIDQSFKPAAHRLVRNTLLVCLDKETSTRVAVIIATIGGLFDDSLPAYEGDGPALWSKTYQTVASICELPPGVEVTDKEPEVQHINLAPKYVVDLSDDKPNLVLADHEEMVLANVQHEYAVDLVTQRLIEGKVKPKELTAFVDGESSVGGDNQAYAW